MTTAAERKTRPASTRLERYLDESRDLVLSEIERVIPATPRYRPILYDLALDYPKRSAKALRPALCIATCRAFGGCLEHVLPSAAVLELYHNAFLVHDDVEDGSELRRDAPTLHRLHGTPIAVNVGDAMLALTLPPLLDNMGVVGLGPAIRILQVIARMARESAEGQAIELDWVRSGRFEPTEIAYLRMVHKKTAWYTFVAPILIGAIVAEVEMAQLGPLRRFASLLGVAFQIQDDVLNLTPDDGGYGKEFAGDLWEGKHTLILLHALRHARPRDAARARKILAKPRATERGEGKIPHDISFLLDLVSQAKSLAYARGVAGRFATRAGERLDSLSDLTSSPHREFLPALVDYVVTRER